MSIIWSNIRVFTTQHEGRVRGYSGFDPNFQVTPQDNGVTLMTQNKEQWKSDFLRWWNQLSISETKRKSVKIVGWMPRRAQMITNVSGTLANDYKWSTWSSVDQISHLRLRQMGERPAIQAGESVFCPQSWQIQKQQISTMFRCPLKYTLLIKNEQIAVRRSVFGLKKKKRKIRSSKVGSETWKIRSSKFKVQSSKVGSEI